VLRNRALQIDMYLLAYLLTTYFLVVVDVVVNSSSLLLLLLLLLLRLRLWLRRRLLLLWRTCVSGGWKPPLKRFATWRHLSSNA